MRSLDEIKVRVLQLLSSYRDRIWVRAPKLSHEGIHLKEGFSPTLGKAYLSHQEDSGEHVISVARDILAGKIHLFGKEVYFRPLDAWWPESVKQAAE